MGRVSGGSSGSGAAPGLTPETRLGDPGDLVTPPKKDGVAVVHPLVVGAEVSAAARP